MTTMGYSVYLEGAGCVWRESGLDPNTCICLRFPRTHAGATLAPVNACFCSPGAAIQLDASAV